MMALEDKGLVYVYTGDGKGKTTAALGLCLTALGQGRAVAFIQFLKGSSYTGELFSTARFGKRWHFAQFGWGCPFSGLIRTGEMACQKCGQCFRENRDPRHRFAPRALAYAVRLAGEGAYHLLVLDEISHAICRGLLPVEDVLVFLRNKPASLAVVLTGRNMPQELTDAADFVSENRLIKHPFAKGIPSRRGIEY